MKFVKKQLDGVGEFLIPDDITLELPKDITLDKKDWHYLTYVPWDDKYLTNIPEDFRDFFKFIFPYLSVRTTDVHIAFCMGFLDEMIGKFPNENVNRRVVGLSLILHDIGWSQLSDREIANSLGVKGLKLSDVAMGPKEKHAVEGEKLARKLLGIGDSDRETGENSSREDRDEVGEKVIGRFQFEPKLSAEEKELIFRSIRYHDKPEEVARIGGMVESGDDNLIPIEVKLLVDLDHIWSFAYEGFWMDVARKGVEPKVYLKNLSNDLDSYFVTDQGKELARKFLDERWVEVGDL